MAAKVSANFTDGLNIGLMVLALVPAMLLPFELFLFVYAILGPLHYLTEINWLHKKQYFTTRKHDYLVLIVFSCIIGFLPFTQSLWRYYIPLFVFIAFFASFGFMFFEGTVKKILFTVVSALIGYLLFTSFYANFRVVFLTLLPTIMHVFLFTGAFILLGALRSKSRLGVASLVVFVACALVTLFAGAGFSVVSGYVAESYSPFRHLNMVMIDLFNVMHVDEIKADFDIPSRFSESDMPIYFSGTGIRIMRFIAFAYTYHYLNWFSKTSVIQWHNTKRRNLVIIAIIWIISVALYIKDYKTGLKWLYVLSFAHVVLEFPLNHLSFVEIKRQLLKRFG
ncbi:hypothetical protein HYN59_17335 [Flavobacterium album]|uniref:Uncharacterized protein n=1 Tax=Flavobacterium album TaxID=2175091 RepID=A0A2S1R292_9FLAO|nr:hypothetical protein [Flavobacterium album]AWH86764.1 hypothetical protein HYN59_17335 [Flavobacterium album]